MDRDEPLILPRGVIFDMDGTLTEPMLDFPLIKREMGIGQRPILEALAEMTPAERARAEAVLHQHEEHAAEQSTLNPGCQELLKWLQERSVPVAVVTRNSRRSLQTVMRRHALQINVLITREDARHKPHPDPLLLACKRLGVDPSDAWMVGDGEYDLQAADAARMKSIWISHDKERDYADIAWHIVRSLPELLDLLKCCSPQPSPARRV